MGQKRIIWGKWDCRSCGAKGISAEPPPGETQAKCPGCGNPREATQGEAAYLDNMREASGRVIDANVADTAEEVAIASGGADWACARCGGDNRAGREQCDGCGAAKGEGSSVLAGPSTSEEQVHAVPRSSDLLARVLGLGAPLVGCGAFLASALACGGYFWWSTRTIQVYGTVSATHWTHRSERQSFATSIAEGWQSAIPSGPSILAVNGTGEYAGAENIRDCGDRHHHDEKVACGTERVCHNETRTVSDGETCSESCTTSDNGNGSFTENCSQSCTPSSRSESYEVCGDQTKYCTRPIMATWCTWDSRAWEAVDAAELKGENAIGGTALPWPALTAGDNERVVHIGRYEADIAWVDGDGKSHSHTTALAGEKDFAEWTARQTARLTVNRSHVVEGAVIWLGK